MGQMWASSQEGGSVPFERDDSKRRHNGRERAVAHSFKTRGWRLSGPAEPPGSRAESSFFISVGVKSTDVRRGGLMEGRGGIVRCRLASVEA